jgi:hypothetical protein
MRPLLLSLLVACGASSSAPAPSNPGPTEPAPAEPAPADTTCDGAATKQVLTPDDCTCLSGRMNASIGGGAQDHCAPQEQEIAPVRFGLEGGWCCRSATPD